MRLEFHDEYFMLVLGVLWLLCFLRPVLRCVADGLSGAVRCLESGCGCEEACGPCLGEYGQHALLLVLFLQPVVMGAAALGGRGREESTVLLVEFMQWEMGALERAQNASSAANASAVSRPRGAGGAQGVQVLGRDVYGGVYLLHEVDYLFFALPFAFAVSLSSLLLVHLSKARILTAGDVWDDTLDHEVLVYEGSYFMELWTLNLSLLAAAGQPRPLGHYIASALALTLVEFYFVITARFRCASAAEHNAGAAMLTLMCVVSGVVFADTPAWQCGLGAGLAVLHLAVSCVLVAMHFAAQGATSARAVVLLRLAVSSAVCAAHLGVLLAGKNRWCGVL